MSCNGTKLHIVTWRNNILSFFGFSESLLAKNYSFTHFNPMVEIDWKNNLGLNTFTLYEDLYEDLYEEH